MQPSGNKVQVFLQYVEFYKLSETMPVTWSVKTVWWPSDLSSVHSRVSPSSCWDTAQHSPQTRLETSVSKRKTDSFPPVSAVHRIADSYFISAAGHIIWCFPFSLKYKRRKTPSVWIIQLLCWNIYKKIFIQSAKVTSPVRNTCTALHYSNMHLTIVVKYFNVII